MPLPVASPFANSGRPLAAFLPPAPDYGTDPSAIDPDSLPEGWTPQGAALLGGSVTRAPADQVAYNLNLQKLVNDAQANTQANAFYAGLPGLDTQTPEGASGLEQLLAANPRAAATPGVQAYVNQRRHARMYQSGRNAPIPPDAESFLASLYSLDPSDNQAFKGVQNNLTAHPELLRDPRVASMVDRFYQHRQSIAMRPQHTKATQDLEDQMALAGISPDEIEGLRDDQGNIPRTQGLYAIAQSKRRDSVPTKEKEDLVSLAQQVQSPSDDAKQAAWEAVHAGQKFDPMNATHWSEGFARAQNEAFRKLQAKQAALSSLGFMRGGKTADPVTPSNGIRVTRIR